MIRMLYLEMKRILKSKIVIIFIGTAILLSIIISTNLIKGVKILDRNFNSAYTGRDAIRKMEEISKQYKGDITPEKLIEANEIYVSVMAEYGGVDNVPEEVYREKIWPVRTLINMVGWISHDPKTGITIPPEDREIESIGNFYSNRNHYIEETLSAKELRNDSVGLEKALSINQRVKTPFYNSSFYGWLDAGENITLLMFLLTVICAAIICPIFSSEYQTESDSVLRCTKRGRNSLAVTKILAGLLLATIVYLACIGIMLGIFCSAFCIEGLSASIQCSLVSCIAPVTFGQGIGISIISGLLTLIAVGCFSLFISSQCNNPMITLIISMVMILLPTILAAFGKGNISNWIRLCLPSGGTGVGSGMLFELLFLTNFLPAGSFSFWSPYVLIIAAVIQIPIFLLLAVRAYNRYEK